MAPPNWDGSDTSTVGWPGWLYKGNVKGVVGQAERAKPAKPVGDLYSKTYTGLWYFYIPNYKVFWCPKDHQVDIKWDKDYSAGGRDCQMSSYVMNGAVCQWGKFPSRKTTDSVIRPSSLLLWEPDYKLGEFVYNDASSFPDPSKSPFEGIGGLHAKGGITVSVSGTAQYMTRTNFSKEANIQEPTGKRWHKNLLIWDGTQTENP
jgi:hypothetical protein